MFKGETLRGLLLTSYGFSEFGTKAAQAATVTYVASGLLFLLALAGFMHALVTPRNKGFAIPEPIRTEQEGTGQRLTHPHRPGTPPRAGSSLSMSARDYLRGCRQRAERPATAGSLAPNPQCAGRR